MNAGGNKMCNKSVYIFHKYKAGNNGVGSNSISVRRAKNRHSTICNNNFFSCYMSLGKYNKSYNQNGYINC